MLLKPRIQHLKVQEYLIQKEQEIFDFTFGNKFAFILRGSIPAIAIFTANKPILILIRFIAFGCTFIKYHPFGNLFNHMLRFNLSKPKLSPRSKKLKFVCILVSVHLIFNVLLFYSDYNLDATIMGIILLISATTSSVLYYCIPTIIYNFLCNVKVDSQQKRE
jgi:drug/metabolite transporter (DMT)-like permease